MCTVAAHLYKHSLYISTLTASQHTHTRCDDVSKLNYNVCFVLFSLFVVGVFCCSINYCIKLHLETRQDNIIYFFFQISTAHIKRLDCSITFIARVNNKLEQEMGSSGSAFNNTNNNSNKNATSVLHDDQIEFLLKHTSFSYDEIKHFHKSFMVQCSG